MSSATTQVLWLAACALVLGAAVWHDVRDNRIPNRLVASALVAGLALSLLPGGIGLGQATLGAGVGLVAFVPLYALRVLGAGDVKFLAALGAFAGFPGVLAIAFYALLAGGVLAVAAALLSGNLGRALGNLRTGALNLLARLFARSQPQAADLPTSAARIPYAVAIAAGMAVHFALQRGLV